MAVNECRMYMDTQDREDESWNPFKSCLPVRVARTCLPRCGADTAQTGSSI